jgi:hypothetical protein
VFVQCHEFRWDASRARLDRVVFVCPSQILYQVLILGKSVRDLGLERLERTVQAGEARDLPHVRHLLFTGDDAPALSARPHPLDLYFVRPSSGRRRRRASRFALLAHPCARAHLHPPDETFVHLVTLARPIVRDEQERAGLSARPQRQTRLCRPA